jgi:hypothetical protein
VYPYAFDVSLAVKFEARLQRGKTVVYETPESGVEFTVKDGKISLEGVSILWLFFICTSALVLQFALEYTFF